MKLTTYETQCHATQGFSNELITDRNFEGGKIEDYCGYAPPELATHKTGDSVQVLFEA